MDNMELWYKARRKGGMEYSVDNYYSVQFTGDGTPLKDWVIFGSAGGVGERTSNLAPPLSEWINGYLTTSGIVAVQTATVLEKTSPYISVTPGDTLKFLHSSGAFPGDSSWRAVCFYDSQHTMISSRIAEYSSEPLQVEIPQNCAYVRLSYRTYGSSEPVYFGLLSAYEPYGYCIPVKCGKPTYKDELGGWHSPPLTKIYIGDRQLSEGDSISFTETEIELLTNDGTNILEVNTTVTPSRIYVLSSCGMTKELCDFMRYRYELAGGNGYE